MKKIIASIICFIALCTCLSGCGSKAPITLSLNGGGVNLSESTDKNTVKEIENKLKEIKLANSDQPLFESVTITENTGIFYNSYRFIATVNQQNTDAKLKLTVNMSGTPSGVRNGIIEGKEVIFPIEDLSQTVELAVEYEENNTGVILVIIATLVVIMAAFIFILKRGGNGYDSY